MTLVYYASLNHTGFASDPWRIDETKFGNPKCFLFSLSLDLKIPYHGRHKLPSSDTTGSRQSHHDCQCAGPDYVQFGSKDLCLKGDFSACTSELEYSYGIGLVKDGEHAKSLLAGASVFKADQVEAWALH